MLYTQATCVYPMLNKTLRDHTHTEERRAFLPYMKLLLKGLNKLPLVRFNVHRAVRVDVHEEYNKLQGKVFRWWAFSSTTLKESMANVLLGKKGDRTMFSIDVIGVDIAAFSAYPDEAEVLMLPGTCLVVDPGVMVEPNYWTFEASVWKAIQQQRHQTHDESEKDENDAEGSPKSMLDDWDDNGDSTTRFQNTDLPHPGWKTIISTQEALPTTGTASIVEPPSVANDGSGVPTSRTTTGAPSIVELPQVTAGV